MHRIYSFFAGVCLSLVAFSSCAPQNNEPEPPISPVLELSDSVYIVDASTKEIQLELNAIHVAEWRVEGYSSWGSVTPTSGKEGQAVLKFTLKENTSYDDRSSTWRIVATNPQAVKVKTITKTVKVTQRAKGAIVISDKNIAIDYRTTAAKVCLASNINFKAVITQGKEWVDILEPQFSKALVNDTVYLSIVQNPTQQERVAKLTISDADGKLPSQDVFITQGAGPDPATVPRFTSFIFTKADNVRLAADISPVSISTNHVVDTIRFETSEILPTLNLKAQFAHTGGVVTVDGQEIESSSAVLNFGQIKSFAIDNGAGIVKQYAVVVYQKTGLPVIYIDTENNAPIVSKDDYLVGRVCFAENPHAGSSSVLEVPTSVKGRGNSTWGMPKKPYKLKLNSKASVFGFPADKEWVLLANYVDPSLLKNNLAFEISKRVGLAYSPRKVQVEVVVNGQHNGSYLLTEQIKISSGRVNVEDLTDANLSGGYLLELDTYFDEDWKFKSSKYNLPVMVKEPDVEQKHIDYLSAYFTEMESVIDSVIFADPQIGYAKYIDADSWINWWIVYEVMGNWEPNHPKSTYITKKLDGKLMLGPVWDFDWNEFNMRTDRFYMTNDGTASSVKMPLYFKRLLQDPAFNAKLKARYAELRSGALSDAQITAYLMPYKNGLNLSAVYNYRLWPQGSSSYATEFDKLLNFTINHMKWLDVNIPNL